MERALVIIDMQKLYFERTPYGKELIGRINECILRAARRGELVIYMKNSGIYMGHPQVSDFVQGLAIVSDNIFVKSEMSAFSSPQFSDFLKEKKVTELLIAGIDGNCCVAATAEDAAKNGMRTELLLPLIGVESKKQFDKTLQRLHLAGVTVNESVEIE